MTDPSLGRKKRKITITASLKGVEVAENALIRLGFDSKSNFAQSQLLARNTVTNFFQRKPIQLDSFKKICQELKLNWRETAGLSEEKQSKLLEIKDYSPDINEGVEPLQTLIRQVTVIDKKSKQIKIEIKLKGDINSVQNREMIEFVLKSYSGDSIAITDIKEGSIRLFVEGSPEDIERLISRIKSGELKEVSGFPVEDVQILSESSDDGESNELNDKWHLVQEIVSHIARGRNLSGADLSDADLSGANLSFANLRDADLSGADLSNADLRDADLRDADLRDANLSGADLSNADVRDANLSRANLSGANLEGAYLSGINLSNADVRDANLSRANLSGANLSGVNLEGANLEGANLRNAHRSGINLNFTFTQRSGINLSDINLSDINLSGINLSRANLSGINLSGINLSGANLSGANLKGTNLKGANLNDAKIKDAVFGHNVGISKEMKLDLIRRGAKFEDSPNDRSEVTTRR